MTVNLMLLMSQSKDIKRVQMNVIIKLKWNVIIVIVCFSIYHLSKTEMNTTFLKEWVDLIIILLLSSVFN